MSRRLPARLKILQGTARPGDVDYVGFSPVSEFEFPEPPPYLNVDGAELWRTFGRELIGSEMLQVVDLYALQTVCYAWQRFVLKAKAAGDISAADLNALRTLFAEFGATPDSRRAVGGARGTPGPQPSANRFNKFKQHAS